jgi:hypothetical protein
VCARGHYLRTLALADEYGDSDEEIVKYDVHDVRKFAHRQRIGGLRDGKHKHPVRLVFNNQHFQVQCLI